MELRGIPLDDGDEVMIPIYIFKDSSGAKGLIATGEGLIKKIQGKYYGSFGFVTSKRPHESGLPPQIEIVLHLVYGSRGQRTPIGGIKFTYLKDEFSGSIEFDDDLDLDSLVRTARSLVNVPW